MLASLSVRNFTVFEQAEFEFSPGLNIIVGENGTGKSQLLKLAYALAYVSHDQQDNPRQTKEEFQRKIAEKLVATLRPESLGRLVTRQPGRNRCEVAVQFSGFPFADYSFSFATNSKSEVKLDAAPTNHLSSPAVFFPTREMLSVFPGFAAAYRNRELEFDETYYDLALALEQRPLKGKRPENVAQLIEDLEACMGGAVTLENGRFYLSPKREGRGAIEMPLVAEGIRKIAMLTHLLSNGVLRTKSILFWDEPETNLHPKLMENIAIALVLLSKAGFQIILATHSLFLLRELAIQRELLTPRATHPRYFSLAEQNGGIQVFPADTLDNLEPLAMLQADLQQSDRYFALQ